MGQREEVPASVPREPDRSRASAPPAQENVQISEAARQAASAGQALPINNSESSRPSYQYYRAAEQESLPNNSQKALQAYTLNRHIGAESQGTGEYLGGIDLFV